MVSGSADSMDHPDRYVGKQFILRHVPRNHGMGSKFFVPGRTAMTRCADDTTFLGYICKSAFAPKITEGQWVDVTVKVAFEKRMEYQEKASCFMQSMWKHVSPLLMRWYISTDTDRESVCFRAKMKAES